jgi:hypothetical protein
VELCGITWNQVELSGIKWNLFHLFGQAFHVIPHNSTYFHLRLYCATGAQSIALRFESESIFSPGNFFYPGLPRIKPDYPGLSRIIADYRGRSPPERPK